MAVCRNQRNEPRRARIREIGIKVLADALISRRFWSVFGELVHVQDCSAFLIRAPTA